MRTIKAKFKSRKKFKSSSSDNNSSNSSSNNAKKSSSSNSKNNQMQNISHFGADSASNRKAKQSNQAQHSTAGVTNVVTKSNSLTSTVTKFSEKSTNKAGGALPNKPAELYRLDFITAMKLPVTELLDENSIWVIRDQWKLDWEKGVQVPVKTDFMRSNTLYKPDQFSMTQNAKSTADNIKMPNKYLCPANDTLFNSQIHQAYLTHGLASSSTLNNTNKICKYDCDSMDLLWLRRVNAELEAIDQERLSRSNLENLIENFELQSYHNIKVKLEKLNSYNLEFDQDTVCDVCRMPDSEENNEMVFCDGCNMCVHQACYGIEHIPQGSWLCSPCDFGGPQFRPECVLCPNSNVGAMKATKNYRYWAHVSCALWIPEVGFSDTTKMEPIINLNKIPPAKWQLTCSLCKEKRGCCLQCAERKCHLAFHVTCAFKFNLEMQNQERCGSGSGGSGGVYDYDQPTGESSAQFKAYCLRHTKKRHMMQNELGEEEEEKENIQEEEDATADVYDNFEIKLNYEASGKGDEMVDDEDDEHLFNLLSKMNENERKVEIIRRIQLFNRHFYKNVNLNLAKNLLGIKNQTHIDLVFSYWKLKRRYNVMTISAMDNTVLPAQNKPLIFHRNEQDLMNRNEHLLINSVKMFVQLRQDLERVRNLSYMTLKREKLKKQVFSYSHEIFLKQVDYLKRYGNSAAALAAAAASSTSTTNVLQSKSINTINSNLAATSSSASNISSSNNNINSRLREILQIKNRECLYDFPELWSLTSQSRRKKFLSGSDSTVISSIRRPPSRKKKVVKRAPITQRSEFVNKIKNKYKSIKLNRQK